MTNDAGPSRSVEWSSPGWRRGYWVVCGGFYGGFVLSLFVLSISWATLVGIVVLVLVSGSLGCFQGWTFYVQGDEFVWRAPLRTRRVPLGWVREAHVGVAAGGCWIGTTRGRLTLANPGFAGRRHLDEAFVRLSQTAHFPYQS